MTDHRIRNAIFFLFISSVLARRDSDYGLLIGPLSSEAHGVSGIVYVVSDEVIFIKNFNYDGTGPSTFFWAGNATDSPSPSGIIIPFPNTATTDVPVLARSDNKDVLLKLPTGVTVRSLKWISVWCRRFALDFGSVQISSLVEPPKPKQLAEFKQLAHGLASGRITVLDDKTFLIPNFRYDGAGPDAFFWAGKGPEPHPNGVKVPNELTDLEVLVGVEGQTIKVQLPGKLTVRDIDWLGVWCIAFRENFGHIVIPKSVVQDVPPALGQNTLTEQKSSNQQPSTELSSNLQFDSCIQLLDGKLQIEWAPLIKGILFRISGRISEDEYMAFGLSGVNGRSEMNGGDVAVSYLDTKFGTFHTDDYFLHDKSQCDGLRGVCPDRSTGGRNDAILLGGDRRDGITTVIYMRPFVTSDRRLDQKIPVSRLVNVIAAIGPLSRSNLALYHSSRTGPEEDIRIDFTSQGEHTCTSFLSSPKTTENPFKPWKPSIIQGESVFTARIGPTGGKKGYTAITGQPSWGIAWYINDLLIPEIYVEEGKTYTFIVEGGNDPAKAARYHPLYITDSPEGGFGQKTEEEQQQQQIFAGIAFDEKQFPIPTAAGTLCEWKFRSIDNWAEAETFEEYKKSMTLDCPENRFSAKMTWTVPNIAGQTLYYQCYRHSHMGWKIHVVKPGFKF